MTDEQGPDSMPRTLAGWAAICFFFFFGGACYGPRVGDEDVEKCEGIKLVASLLPMIKVDGPRLSH